MTNGTSMDLTARLDELARITRAPGPVVSVYLDIRWADEHQRDRVRVFVQNEVRRARQAPAPAVAAEDLEWVEARATALIDQVEVPEANGVALFACHALGLREMLPVRLPFEEAFVVAEAPYLRPLAALRELTPSTLIVFVDTESARLIPLTAEGAGTEVRLESEVRGHHRRGGWAQLAQSRYQRYGQANREQHFEAVVEALLGLIDVRHVQAIVLAGETRMTGLFHAALPRRAADRVVGTITGARYEPASALVARASALLEEHAASEAAAVEAVLTEAAKGRRAVAGMEEALEAVNRRAVLRLYLLGQFREDGQGCPACGMLQRGAAPRCRACGAETRPTELGEAMVERVVAAGGTVETLAEHAGLSGVGGVAGFLRYEL